MKKELSEVWTADCRGVARWWVLWRGNVVSFEVTFAVLSQVMVNMCALWVTLNNASD